MLIDLLSLQTRLSALTRFSMERPTERESVLEHTGFVALTCLVLVSGINRIEVDDPIDVGDLLTRALIHDLEEVVTGDVARPTKYFCEEAVELFDRLSSLALDKVADKMKAFPAFAEVVLAYGPVTKAGRPGTIVAIADVLAVVYMVWREVLIRGNVSMVRQAFTVENQLDALSVRVADHFDGRACHYLMVLLREAKEIMLKAQLKDQPIHGMMREDQ
jgi:5'-deoxynucleotidase